MLPSMAAMVPGGCVEVDQSQCGAPPPTSNPPLGGTPTTPSTVNPWAAPGQTLQTSTAWDGPTEITVLAKEATELNPYTDGADVLIQGYNIRNFDSTTGVPVLAEVARGKTDANGKYVWSGNAPTPNTEYRYRVTVSVPGGSSKTMDVQARLPDVAAGGIHALSRSELVVPACAPNIDRLICAVAEDQLQWTQMYKQQLVAWNYASAGPGQAKISSYAANFATSNMSGLGHPALDAHFTVFRWWIADLSIKPKEWPDLIKNYNQAWNIFVAIPFPRWPGIENLFQRCAHGIPIGQGKNNERYSVASPYLYVKKFCNYFPRADKQISKDMAAAYSVGLQAILLCMKDKIEKAIENAKKTMRNMAFISYCVILVNLPMLIGLGVGGFALIATETYDFIKIMGNNEPLGLGVSASLAAAAFAAGQTDLVTAALTPIIRDLMKDMDPLAAQAVSMIYPQVVRLAVDAVGSIASTSAQSGSNLIANGASSFLDMSAIGGAIAVMAIKAIAALPKMYAAKKMEELQDALAGAQSAAQDVIAFVAGEEVSPVFKPFLIWVVEAMGLVELVNQAIDDFLNQFQQAHQVGTEQGGGVAVVPEAGGGGPSVVPTDPAGAPTDVHGAPLPAGEAPLTPPSGGGDIPGVPHPPMPPMPTSTTTPGMEGATGVTTLGAAAGVGGATLALLLVTGAVS